MTTCTSCGNDVTGKKFCSDCGTPVHSMSAQAASGQFSQTCSHCSGEVKPGASFCMHCGAALNVSRYPANMPSVTGPATHACPACHALVPGTSMFCTQCGHDMRVAVAPRSMDGPVFCTSCGKQNDAALRFCGGCGAQLITASQAGYTQPDQYNHYAAQSSPQSPYQNTPYPSQAPYPQQPIYQQAPYSSPPPQSQPYAGQSGYQPQPMVGQSPMVLHCPTCMAMAPMGTPNCVRCQTSLAGVVPAVANMSAPGQQGVGGLLQGNAGKYAMGALGGVAAVLGGEMLLNGVENSIENRVEGDLGMGAGRRHHHHRNEGLLGSLGGLADEFGL